MRAQRRVLLFDIDGTLLTTRGQGMLAMHTALQRTFDIAPCSSEVRPGGKTDPMLFDEIAAAYGIPPGFFASRRQDFVANYVAEFEERMSSQQGLTDVKPGVRALLEQLAARDDVELGLATGNIEPTAWVKVRSGDLAGFFRTGGFGSDARERAGVVKAALARFRAAGVSFVAEDVWVIGDTPADVASAVANGVRSIAVATGGVGLEALRQTGADVVLETLSDSAAVLRCLGLSP